MKNKRRALSQLGGRVRVSGDHALGEALARIWRGVDKDAAEPLTHGFHSWPARMHWSLARGALERFAAETVLDPFCGGGTVLVEARATGRRAYGVDLNPLSAPLCRVKVDKRDPEKRARFLEAASAVAEASEERVRERVPIHVNLPKSEIRWYAPHVLKELGGLHEEIGKVESTWDREALSMVFSSIVVKVSTQRADTSEHREEKRIRKGLVTEFFVRKAEELEERWESFFDVATGPAPKLFTADARRLSHLLRRQNVDLILTSPPYGGTYDYAQHHQRRIAWLGLDDRKLQRKEIGARRRYSRGGSPRVWDREVGEMLESMRAVLNPSGNIVLVMGDAQLGRRVVPLLPQLAKLAPIYGLSLVAAASEFRPAIGKQKRREEHLVLLKPI